MKQKYSFHQKSQLKELRKLMSAACKYKPCGQGDGINNDLKIRELSWEIEETKKNPEFYSNKF